MYAIGLRIALIKIKEVFMAMDPGFEDCNVDHFLISTCENQFLLIFIDQVDLRNSLEEISK
jgi:hypothetical protein